MELVQKYLKITQEDFRLACEISHRVRNSFFTVLLSVLQLLLLLAFRMLCENFAQPCEIARCQISSLILFLAYLIDLAKATKLSKTWILHVFELQLALPWIIQNYPSFLVSFNDKKNYQKHQNLPKTDQKHLQGSLMCQLS